MSAAGAGHGFRERELSLEVDPLGVLEQERRRGGPTIFLDGRGGARDPWATRIAVGARRLRSPSGDPGDDLDLLERRLRARRGRGGSRETGIVALVAFEALGVVASRARGRMSLPPIVLLEVDAAVWFPEDGRPILVTGPGARSETAFRDIERTITQGREQEKTPAAVGRARTSLSREAYLRAVDEIRSRIVAGDIYQANLTQRFDVPFGEDPLGLYRRVTRKTPAPRSAFVEFAEGAVLSTSPEVFLDATPDGRIRTLPIKGTRPRGDDEDADRLLRNDLLASEKDRAELMMIVDLERNDLGRVCTAGSIRLSAPADLRSYPTVHHLVAEVEGRLRPGIGAKALLEATFPGGSISGAPKLRALEILRAIEPVDRGYYTGSLLWFGDDGSMESSILIRSIVVSGGVARIGAGGGIVADSDPEAEWREANHKARGLTRALGFEPEEAR